MQNGTKDILSLVGDIYDAAFQSDLWPATLARITDAVGGSQVMMGVHDFATQSLQVIAPRMDPDHLNFYATQWAADDILWERTNRAPIGTVLIAERFVSPDELKNTGLYNEWYRAVSIGTSGLGVNLPGVNGVPTICGVKRSARNDYFSHDDVEIFAALVPHLVRATQIHHQLWELDLKAQFARAEIDSQRYGVMVVDRQGKLIYCNDIAAGLLQTTPTFRFDFGIVSIEDPDNAKKLKRFIAACAASSSNGNHLVGGEITLARLHQAPLQIRVSPFPQQQRQFTHAWNTQGKPVAILLIRDLEHERTQRKTLLQNHLGLTPAEAELALEILLGDGREAAAARLGITTGTARIHLQRIFQKLGVHRQAELILFITEFLKAH